MLIGKNTIQGSADLVDLGLGHDAGKGQGQADAAQLLGDRIVALIIPEMLR